MQFTITDRFTAEAIFTTEIDATEDTPYSIQLGLAVRAAVSARADLAGANLAWADLAWANLAWANLARANLAGANLAGADLAGADLARANLAGADLAGANLAWADLAGANLAWADLARANLAGAKWGDLSAIPLIENLDAKILAAIEAGGSLKMGSWHTCETTHCRAGWAIHLAGDAGKALELAVGPAIAGALIYQRSTGRIPDFYATNEAALADIREQAAKGAA